MRASDLDYSTLLEVEASSVRSAIEKKKHLAV